MVNVANGVGIYAAGVSSGGNGDWDPAAQTALSDEEVVYKEEHGKLYYLRYKIVGEDGYAIVATTRPETNGRTRNSMKYTIRLVKSMFKIGQWVMPV